MGNGSKQPNFEEFCQFIAEGNSQIKSFKMAGGFSDGDTKAWLKAAQRFASKSEVKSRVQEIIQEKALDTQISLLKLTPAAIKCMEDVLNDTKASTKDRVKVAENVLGRVRDFAPKEINVQHNHKLEQIDLDVLIDKFLEHAPGSAAKLIEGEVEEQSGPSRAITDNSEQS